MTITADYAFAPAAATGIPYKLDGGRLVLRTFARIGAVACALVAVLIWLAPGATWESDAMLFKLLLFVVALMAAVGLWQVSLAPLPPTVEVDVVNREVRLIRAGAPTADRVIERCAFDDLHAVELQGRHITFWARGQRLLAEITLSNASAHAALLGALRAVGKLDPGSVKCP